MVDDSAFVRKTVRAMLATSPAIEVIGVARDGVEALSLAEELRPDVITCDLIMPNLGGVDFVRRQMAVRPVPILVLTASPEDAEQAVAALSAGAVDLVQKPTALASDELLTIRDQLVDRVKAAGAIDLRHLARKVEAQGPRVVGSGRGRVDLVAIGISTGGPQALRQLLPSFPADFPVPIAVVLHMPVGYTALYAEKLAESCALRVKEAAAGDLVVPGTVLVAAAGRHLAFVRDSTGRVSAALPVTPIEKLHRPSVDVLFQSASAVFGGRVLAVVMTGMGEDGREGAAWVKAQGGTVLTESEKSCVVYGMPRSVDEAGLSDGSFELNHLAKAITDRL